MSQPSNDVDWSVSNEDGEKPAWNDGTGDFGTRTKMLVTSAHDSIDEMLTENGNAACNLNTQELQQIHQALISERSMKIYEAAKERAQPKESFPHMTLTLAISQSFMRHLDLIAQVTKLIAEKLVKEPQSETVYLFRGYSASLEVELHTMSDICATQPFPRLNTFESFYMASELVNYARTQILALQNELIAEKKGSNDAVWTYIFSDYANIVKLEAQAQQTAAQNRDKAWSIPKHIRDKFEKRARGNAS